MQEQLDTGEAVGQAALVNLAEKSGLPFDGINQCF